MLNTRKSRYPARRAFWMAQLHQWHWVSSALRLIGLLAFALTGFTRNPRLAARGHALGRRLRHVARYRHVGTAAARDVRRGGAGSGAGTGASDEPTTGYRHAVVDGGRVYSHHIDPCYGYPAVAAAVVR